jgi:hypothetical protein
LIQVEDFFKSAGYGVAGCPPSPEPVDFVASKSGATQFFIDLKSGAAGDYLPYSAYSEAQRLKAIAPETAQPVLFTNMIVSDDLRTLFEEAKFPVVVVEGRLDQNVFSERFNQALARTGKNVSFEVGSTQTGRSKSFLSGFFPTKI